jgi:eukaryotic-like serine/threonine-protein kinase
MSELNTEASSNRQRYQIVKKLDMGGMAEIFLGRAQSIEGIERPVAIKRVLPSLTRKKQFMSMFLDEARLSMQLTHANIVQVFDVGRASGTIFIVMEYVDGYNLRRLFQRASERGFKVPVEIACHLVIEVCKGLTHAHEKVGRDDRHLKIVHRDLSPPNILVSRSGEVKITDFGLAKALTQATVTDPGIVKGKFSYLSPEAAEGQQVDHRADIFALGICLWELLANRRLFLGADDAATVELVREAEIPSLTTLNPGVTEEFERLVQRSLARDPHRRFTSAAEFGDAVANYLFANSLKVTSYDLAKMVARLFSSSPAGEESAEERIDSMIREEIANQSVIRQSPSRAADGSQPIDVQDLNLVLQPRFDLSEFWSNAGVDSGAGDGHLTATVKAIEGARSPDELLEMLEGQEELLDEPEPSTDRDGRLRWIALVVAALIAGAAVTYAIAPGLFGGMGEPSASAPAKPGPPASPQAPTGK